VFCRVSCERAERESTGLGGVWDWGEERSGAVHGLPGCRVCTVNLTYSQTDILDGIIALREQSSNSEERSDPDVVAGSGPKVK